MVILREGDVYVKLVADIAVFELRLKARDELTGTKLKAVFLRLTAVKRNPVNAAFKVERGKKSKWLSEEAL